MSTSKIFALMNATDKIAATFPGFTLDEAQARGRMIAQSLGIGGEWRVAELEVRPDNAPWFDEAYFALIAQVRGGMS